MLTEKFVLGLLREGGRDHLGVTGVYITHFLMRLILLKTFLLYIRLASCALHSTLHGLSFAMELDITVSLRISTYGWSISLFLQVRVRSLLVAIEIGVKKLLNLQSPTFPSKQFNQLRNPRREIFVKVLLMRCFHQFSNNQLIILHRTFELLHFLPQLIVSLMLKFHGLLSWLLRSNYYIHLVLVT